MCSEGRELNLDEKSIFSIIISGVRSAKRAKVLHLTSLTICRYLKQFRERGSVENENRSGRPRSMTVRNQTAVSRIVKKNLNEYYWGF